MYAAKFSQLANAESFRQHASKAMMIVLGDDSRFWVVRPVDAERLGTQGYTVL